ncbi:MAG TPA: sodium:calcium antiporter, partial [Nitrospiria bacterium]|nr:sodium:calcium antiporter [Nitrospiria bacterium]
MVWIKFLICAVLIFISGTILSKYADMLADKTGMGRTWIGLILLATVTSLPDLATGISSVTVANAPDIAAGDVLGSCVFNLMLIGMIDLFYKPAPVLTKAQQGNILSAGFGILLIGLASLGIVLGTQTRLWSGGWISPLTPVIFVVYYAAIRMVFQYEKKRMSEFIKAEAETLEAGGVELPVVYRNIVIHSVVIIAAGSWLPFIGNEIAEITGWGKTFVGGF